ncbi:MAG TPA: hypothetical protein VFU40_03755 [Gemmatimonadales bacterium]|nr:hypothetical protein [Gemmatimonadales bacterium]
MSRNSRTLNSSAILSEPGDFSLVLGGPLYQLWRRLHAAGPAMELLARRVISLSLLAWLPLLVLTAYEGLAIGAAVTVPFLHDLEVHARFLVGVPLLLVAEVIAHRRIKPVVRHFVDAGIVTPAVLPGFRAAIDRAVRLRNSLAIELLLAVAVFGFGWMLWKGLGGLTTSTWYASVGPSGKSLTLAGQWYGHVSNPIFQFLLLRWYFRLLVWFVFLRRVSRLDLYLTPTHPDRAGGLGFLASAPSAFAPVILAQSTFLAGFIAARILFHNMTLQAFQYEIATFLVLQLLVVLGPLFVFAPTLLALKRRGRLEYGSLAVRYTQEFHEKWISGAAPPGEPLVGSGDIQSLADLANSYEVVGGMRAVPFGRDTIIQLAVPALIPFAPLLLTVIPADELLKSLLGILL